MHSMDFTVCQNIQPICACNEKILTKDKTPRQPIQIQENRQVLLVTTAIVVKVIR